MGYYNSLQLKEQDKSILNSAEQENEISTNIEDKSTDIKDSSLTEEINEQSSNGLENFGFEDETPELFNSVEDSPTQESTLLENEQNESEEDDLEIPAFLRRQKN